jgi:hypothetical protein
MRSQQQWKKQVAAWGFEEIQDTIDDGHDLNTSHTVEGS